LKYNSHELNEEIKILETACTILVLIYQQLDDLIEHLYARSMNEFFLQNRSTLFFLIINNSI